MADTIQITKGVLRVYFVFEVGREINLEQAQQDLKDTRKMIAPDMKAGRNMPFFGFDPPPLLVQQMLQTRLMLGEFPPAPKIELRLWPFGAVSVEYQIPLPAETTLDKLVELRSLVADDEQLELDARTRTDALVKAIGTAIRSPHIPQIHEDYVIAEIDSVKVVSGSPELTGARPEAPTEPVPPPLTAEDFLSRFSSPLVRFLRQEAAEDVPSADVVGDVMDGKFSWTTTDFILIDWNSAIVYGPENDVIFKLLELVQVQLLELKYLEHQLENRYDGVYEHASKELEEFSAQKIRSWRALRYRARKLLRGLWSMATLGLLSHEPVEELRSEMSIHKLDATHAYKSIGDAVNLLGHATLHTIYTLACKRAHFDEVRHNIETSMVNTGDLIDHFNAETGTKQSHRLEIIVIILILIEIIRH